MSTPSKTPSVDKQAPTLRIDQEHCPTCDWPGIYIRRRYFKSMFSDVWMCNNDACKMSGRYWHRDSPAREWLSSQNDKDQAQPQNHNQPSKT